METKFWYFQTMDMLTHCINDLSYANQNDIFTEEEIKRIDFKARELCGMIPDFNKVQDMLSERRLGFKVDKAE